MILSDEKIKVIFLSFYEKQYGQEAAKMLYDQLPDCNYAKAIAEAQQKDMLRWFVKWGYERCPHVHHIAGGTISYRKKCFKCWMELKDKLAELEKE